MKTVIDEDFSDLELNEFPYDKFHTALGEYHYIKQDGIYGNWYDPICLHQWRSLDGSWLVTSDGSSRYMEQNRGHQSKGAFENVFCCLTHKQKLYANYTLEFDLRLFEVKNYCGVAFNYITSRKYDFIGIKKNEIVAYNRCEEEFKIYVQKDFILDDLKTYHFKIIVDNNIKLYIDDNVIFEFNMCLIEGSLISLVAKSSCRYSNIRVLMTNNDYNKHALKEQNELKRLDEKMSSYPKLKCIHKINLKNFGSGRQLRIRLIDGKPIFLIAQHQKRMIRDSFARLSCLTCFDINGNILWQKGEPNNCKDNTLISCDLPFQIADINNDGKYEVIYSMDFMVYICDLLTGNVIKQMPTPIIEDDPLVLNEPYYRLNVDAIRVADFENLGYKGDFILKDRYQNVWAYDKNMELMWRYHHKNTGHFPYIYDFNNDGNDEMFVGYDLVDSKGNIIFSLPMNSDHTDEIIYARLNIDEPKRLILASGNEGFNIVNLDGSIYKHNEVGHAQRISIANYMNNNSLQILVTSFWGSDGIINFFDSNGDLLKTKEFPFNGNIITPVNYDGKHILSLLNASKEGGLIDDDLDIVVKFPDDLHPITSIEVYDIDSDGIDEIICFDNNSMWIYKAESYVLNNKKYIKYSDDAFSNYRGEFLIPEEYEV